MTSLESIEVFPAEPSKEDAFTLLLEKDAERFRSLNSANVVEVGPEVTGTGFRLVKVEGSGDDDIWVYQINFTSGEVRPWSVVERGLPEEEILKGF